ncbi:MAG: hypothetical protein DBY04_03485 [Clostridiales bacterium]|nr:MAG: hypothetical protein DBY04_03485 [Clostridiales bacterium]
MGLRKLFFFCIKKTENHIEAKNSTQDTALQIITFFEQEHVTNEFFSVGISAFAKSILGEEKA